MSPGAAQPNAAQRIGAQRRLAVVIGVIALALLSMAAALSLGSRTLSPAHLFDILASRGDALERDVVLLLRLPRASAAFACGALLALAGTLLQVLLRNPLADPFLLGVSGGAAVGALGALLLGLAAAAPLFALGGACVASAFVLAFAFSGGWNTYRVLLAGVAFSSGFGALVGLMLTLAPAAQVQGMLFWLLGDLSGAGSGNAAAWAVLAVTGAIALTQAGALNVLALGDDKARSLGVPVTAIQLSLFVVAAGATVAAVLIGGSIGFIGLLVPHLLRLTGVHDHRLLLPLGALLGGALLTLADTVARSAAAPVELPVGVVTALIGVPALIALLARPGSGGRR
ncbi:MAG: iron ABC transporter permease [Betaproteobacteria bacterium]|nr:iron ABC transporter permease [Betaproteobacteria bacterium]